MTIRRNRRDDNLGDISERKLALEAEVYELKKRLGKNFSSEDIVIFDEDNSFGDIYD